MSSTPLNRAPRRQPALPITLVPRATMTSAQPRSPLSRRCCCWCWCWCCCPGRSSEARAAVEAEAPLDAPRLQTGRTAVGFTGATAAAAAAAVAETQARSRAAPLTIRSSSGSGRGVAWDGGASE
eukprot:117831-Chlamydomonas_euryale.AAC.1